MKKNTDFNFTDRPVGEILRRTREHYRQSLADVENNTRIRAHLVQAIEENDVAKLPARVYAIGFVRSYAEYLGLDGDKMVELFKGQAGVQAQGPKQHVSATLEDHSTPPLWMVVASAFLLIVIGWVWASSWGEQRQSVERIPAVSPDIQRSAFSGGAHEEKIDAEDVPLEVNEDALADEVAMDVGIIENPPGGIILNIRANSWVEIRDAEGKRLISRVLKAGDRYFVPDRPELTMSLGNAGGVELQIDDKVLSRVGRDAQVRRNIPLDVSYLEKTFPAP